VTILFTYEQGEGWPHVSVELETLRLRVRCVTATLTLRANIIICTYHRYLGRYSGSNPIICSHLSSHQPSSCFNRARNSERIHQR